MNNITLITKSELVARLVSQTKQTIISMVSVTEPDMLAKSKDGSPNPYRIGKGKSAEILLGKVIKVNGTINGKYDRIVTNKAKRKIIAARIAANLPPLDAAELEAEAAQVPQFGESWHEPILDRNGAPTCFSRNKKNPNNGKMYIRFIFRSKGDAEYLHLADGRNESSESVYPYLAPQSTYENQNLEEGEEVRFVVYDIDNIAELSLNGERFRILDNFASHATVTRNKVWNIANEYLEGQRSMSNV